MSRINRFLVILIIFIGQGCATADLRSKSLKKSGLEESRVNQGRLILQQASWRQDKSVRWERFDEWTVITRDLWKSGLIRRFTPVTESEQRLEFRFWIKKDQAEMTFLNGRRLGDVLGVEEGRTYVDINGRKKYVQDSKLELYLAPVRDYFFWPQDLVNSKIIAYDGLGNVDGRSYHRIFATDGKFAPASEADQYVIWVDALTFRIRFVEFTLRKLFKSYKGAVEYADYREIQGLYLPHKIILKDKVDTEKHSHMFLVQDMRFEKKRTDVSFIMKIIPMDFNFQM